LSVTPIRYPAEVPLTTGAVKTFPETITGTRVCGERGLAASINAERPKNTARAKLFPDIITSFF
jgi:hypothetical protein